MVGYPFLVKGKEVSYSVGNPMGALSSWATFALAHHFVVFCACKWSRKSWPRSKYVLLGDDILIGDPKIGKVYLRILTLLGVEYSPSKTYVSRRMCEFAKRVVVQGEEVTPFPISSVSGQPWSIPLVVSAIRGERQKEYYPISGIPKAVRSLQETVYPSMNSQRRDIVEHQS